MGNIQRCFRPSTRPPYLSPCTTTVTVHASRLATPDHGSARLSDTKWVRRRKGDSGHRSNDRHRSDDRHGNDNGHRSDDRHSDGHPANDGSRDVEQVEHSLEDLETETERAFSAPMRQGRITHFRGTGAGYSVFVRYTQGHWTQGWPSEGSHVPENG